jgi:hypothetical protein
MNLREIKGFGILDGNYLVSECGKVFSKDRFVHTKKYSYSKSGVEISQFLNKSGYYYVMLCVEKQKRNIAVHKLVANAFLNHIPCGYETTIDHVDGNKKNNHISNLQEISSADNVRKHFEQTNKKIGVCFNKTHGLYQSRISIDKKRYLIGYFEKEEDAINSYKRVYSCYKNNEDFKKEILNIKDDKEKNRRSFHTL